MARGHLRKRSSDTWTLVIELGKDESGKRKQKWVTHRGTKKEAEKELARLLVEAERGTLTATPKQRLSDFLEQWLEYTKGKVSPKTHLRYQGICRVNIVPHLGTIQLAKLTPAHVVSFVTKLREMKSARKSGGKLSASSQRQIYRVLHIALGCAVDWRLIPNNPSGNVAPPAPAHVEMRYFTTDQAGAALAAAEAEGLYWHTFFVVAMTTGLRLGEMFGLRWQDVDVRGGTLTVRQTIQWIPKVGPITKSPKTAGSRRPVAIGADVGALLIRHRVAQNEQRLQLGPAWQDNDLVFPHDDGQPLTYDRVRGAFDRICKRADVPRIRIHDLRHTAATLLLTANVHPKIVSERLGHSSIGITLQIYSHIGETLQRQAADTLDQMLRRPDAATAR